MQRRLDMANNKSTIRPVSFKKDELYLLEELEKRYNPFSFSNYVKQLIVNDIGEGVRKPELEKEGTKPAEKDIKSYNLDAQRDEIDLV